MARSEWEEALNMIFRLNRNESRQTIVSIRGFLFTENMQQRNVEGTLHKTGETLHAQRVVVFKPGIGKT